MYNYIPLHRKTRYKRNSTKISYIMAKQEKQTATVADLKQDAGNYRKHSEDNKKKIKKSIDEAGLGRSVVVDADGVLVAGNGVASVLPDDTPVRVIETDGTELVVVKRTDLHTDDERRKLLALADNATSDNVEWDMEAIEADGWQQDELTDWGVVEMQVETKPAEPKKDLSEEIQVEYKIEVDCIDESQQEKLFNELTEKGYQCRILTL